MAWASRGDDKHLGREISATGWFTSACQKAGRLALGVKIKPSHARINIFGFICRRRSRATGTLILYRKASRSASYLSLGASVISAGVMRIDECRRYSGAACPSHMRHAGASYPPTPSRKEPVIDNRQPTRARFSARMISPHHCRSPRHDLRALETIFRPVTCWLPATHISPSGGCADGGDDNIPGSVTCVTTNGLARHRFIALMHRRSSLSPPAYRQAAKNSPPISPSPSASASMLSCGSRRVSRFRPDLRAHHRGIYHRAKFPRAPPAAPGLSRLSSCLPPFPSLRLRAMPDCCCWRRIIRFVSRRYAGPAAAMAFSTAAHAGRGAFSI